MQSVNKEQWEQVQSYLEQNLKPQSLKWIKLLTFHDVEKSPSGITFKLSATTGFTASWVRDQLTSEIEQAISACTGQRGTFDISILETAGDSPSEGVSAVQKSESQDQTPISGEVLRTSQSYQALPTSSPSQGIQPHYIFDTFVVGASNQVAHASAVAVAEKPTGQYNPLFIYGPSGLGKTHLLHAIGNHALSTRPGVRVLYLTAESFVNEMIDAIGHRRMSQFHTKYRESYDIILIDDIQFLSGKTQSQEEFFHTFNVLHSSQRQIVMTSDRPAVEIEKLEERLRTRFEWGMTVAVGVPEIETRIAILKVKAERDDIYLPDDVAVFLATYIKSSVRALEGILNRLHLNATLNGAEISLEMAKAELKTLVPTEGSQFTVESIQNAVIRHFKIKLQDLKSNSRKSTVAHPRQICAYLIRKYTGISFDEIGRYLGGKDHSTIMHACKKVEASIASDPSVKKDVEDIQNLL